MNWDEIKHALERPFPVKDVSWRVGARNREKTKGIALAYIDARDVMKRLDDVCGANWQCRYPLTDGKLLICEIGILITTEHMAIDGITHVPPKKEWIWRADGAGDSDIEAEKGKASDSFKRAACRFGIARYLYSLPNVWCQLKDEGKSLAETPELPSWATPEGYDKIMQKRKEK